MTSRATRNTYVYSAIIDEKRCQSQLAILIDWIVDGDKTSLFVSRSRKIQVAECAYTRFLSNRWPILAPWFSFQLLFPACARGDDSSINKLCLRTFFVWGFCARAVDGNKKCANVYRENSKPRISELRNWNSSGKEEEEAEEIKKYINILFIGAERLEYRCISKLGQLRSEFQGKSKLIGCDEILQSFFFSCFHLGFHEDYAIFVLVINISCAMRLVAETFVEPASLWSQTWNF